MSHNPHLLIVVIGAFAGGCACNPGHTTTARGHIEAAPASLDFGTTTPGIAVERPVSLVNQGQAAVQLSAMTVGGEAAGQFSLKPVASTRVEAGGSLEVVVVYLPAGAGNHSARLFVESDASNAPELVVPLSGLAVASDLCAGITCSAPPGPCFGALGTCSAGTCAYLPRDAGAPCDDGNGCTESDACSPAGACEGTAKRCENPPAPACVDAQTLRRFDPVGSCAGAGSCSYASHDTPCAFGCANGACAPDPCLGMSCAQPPAPTCADAATRRTYASSGTCGQGACGYPATDAPCSAGEACQAGTCQWNDASLLSLAVSPKNIAFSPAQTAYALVVPQGTTSVVVTAAVAQPPRTVLRVAGTITASGTPVIVTLGGGPTTVAIRVDAESGASATTSLVVTVAVTAQQAYVKASNTETFDEFGNLLALSADGNTLAVAALREDSSATGVNGAQADNAAPESGAVYVFARGGGGWVQQAYVKASNTAASDHFGSSLALSADGTTLVVGACDESTGAGAVYVFTRAGSTWTQQASLKASNTEAHDRFGVSLALSGDGSTLVVGADGEASSATGAGGNQADNSAPGAGAAYVFTHGTAWTQQAYLKASNTGAYDRFGVATALSGDGSTLVVGADVESSSAVGVGGNQLDNAAPASGAAYVFTRGGAGWAQQAYLKASNTEANDAFGGSLAVSADGNTVAVGAPSEGSSATGVDGSQTNNSAPLSGATYVFARAGTTWAQQAYVKASNTGSADNFGRSVALSADGTALAVGAHSEDSSARGVGGNQADNSATNSGAVYVFTLAGAVWAQQAYVKTSNADAFNHFGDGTFGLSVDGSTLAVGAYGESSNATGVGGNQADNSATNSGAVYVFTR